MEFLRFGSSIPGGYHGCCAVCIIQNFNFPPEQPASIQLTSGDGGGPVIINGQPAFVGPTYHDIFKARIRIGTFSTSDMPDHAFLAVLTENQINGEYGKKWLAILKEEGFEFIRTQSNSVYTGVEVPGKPGEPIISNRYVSGPHKNHIFGLFRNIQKSRVDDPFTPPKQWTDLPSVVPEGWEAINPEDRKRIADTQTEVGRQRWHATGPTKFLTEAELVAAGAPVIMAGLRSNYPPEPKALREGKLAAAKANSKQLGAVPF